MNRNTDYLCPVDQFLEDKEVKFLCGHDEEQMEVKKSVFSTAGLSSV